MTFLKHASRIILVAVFGFLAFLLPFVIAFNSIAKPETITNAVRGSGAYASFVPAVFADSASISQDSRATELLNDKGVRAAAESAFTPQLVQSGTESFITALFRWLDGTDPELTFMIDLTQARTDFLSNLTAYASTRAATLPSCSLEQLQQLGNTQDILSIPCLPPGLSATRAAEQFSNDALANADFLRDPVLTAEDLPKNANGQSLATNSELPSSYRLLQIAPFVLGLFMLVIAVGIVLLYQNRRQGLQKLGYIFVGTGVAVILNAMLYWVIVTKVPLEIATQNSAMQAAVSSILEQLIVQFSRIIGVCGLIYVVVGIILQIVTRKTSTLNQQK